MTLTLTRALTPTLTLTQALTLTRARARARARAQARALTRLNGAQLDAPRPEQPPQDGPSARGWWRYAVACTQTDRRQKAITTEITGVSWAALLKVLRIRKRYLQLHRLGRYRVKGQRRLSDKEVG